MHKLNIRFARIICLRPHVISLMKMNLGQLVARIGRRAVLQVIFTGTIALLPGAAGRAAPPPMEEDGTIHVPGFDLPASSFLDASFRAALQRPDSLGKAYQAALKAAPRTQDSDREALAGIRRAQAKAFYETSFYKNNVTERAFTPTSGVSLIYGRQFFAGVNVHF